MTLSKGPWFLSRNANAMKSSSGRLLFFCASCTTSSARFLIMALVVRVWINDGLGSVFLKRSSASSSFKILMVSARASNSSARTLQRSSHSVCFVEQPFSNSAKNFLSSSKAFLVSSRSSFISTISRPVCPTRSSLDSKAAWFASSSFFFCSHQRIIIFDCLFFCSDHLSQSFFHGVLHLL